MEEQKNTLKQIANRTNKRIKTLLGQPNPIDILQLLAKRRESKNDHEVVE